MPHRLFSLTMALFLGGMPASAHAAAESHALPGASRPSLPDIRDAYGVALADYDGDRDIDIYLVGFRSLNRLLVNRGKGEFRDASIASGAGGNLMPKGNTNLELGASAADFDNDGDVDLVIAGWGESLEILRNRGDGTFEAVTENLGVARDIDANMALFSDMDGDGWLDLLLTHETGPMRLYRNDRGIRFKSMELSGTGLPSDSGSQAALFADFDMDGRADLAVAGWHNPAQVFLSEGNFRFSRVDLGFSWTPGSRCNAPLHGDFDSDGDLDLLFTVRGGLPLLLRNLADPPLRIRHPGEWIIPRKPLRFSLCDSSCGLRDTLDAYGGAFFDADGDNDFDLYLTGRQSEKYYENQKGRFISRPVSTLGWPETGSLYSTGFAAADLNPAPGMDAVIATRDTGCLLVTGPRPRLPQARVELRGVASNPQGLGSQISLWRQVPADSVPSETWAFVSLHILPGAQGYLSSYLGPVDLALPDTAATYRVRVAFPSGRVVTRAVEWKGGTLEIWEYGLFGALEIKASRLFSLWLGDPGHLKRLGFWIALGLAAIYLLRLVIGLTAKSIAQREFTKTLLAKNRELENLLDQLHRTQEQLIQHEKLASLGQLVAGIAHELNNPIGFIYANLQQIGRYIHGLPAAALDERTRRNLARIDEALRESQEGALRVRDIVQNLRGLSRSGNQGSGIPPEKVPCDVRELLDKALNVARTSFATGIAVEKDYADIPLIAVDPGQIQQVFLNLLVNAGQAMGERGLLKLSVQAMGGEIVIHVRDNGPGISKENLARIFDPFFTTKAIGQGLGLGLHLAYTLIKAHGGELDVQSEPHQGADFRLRLPIPD